jgi:putative peptide zinc metalloprotease protein
VNLAEALVQALPELPMQTVAKRKARFSPDVIVREEQDENGDPIAVIYVPEHAWMLRVPQIQYQLLQLFDGERSLLEVAHEFESQTGAAISEEQLRQFVADLDDTGIWYKSALERNITLSQKLAAERSKRIKQKSKFADVSHIMFKGWDPDRFFDWTAKKFAFVYTTWFTLLTLGLFAFMTWIWIDQWSQISHDTILYYTFTQKTGTDLAEFWVLFLIMAFFHESAHGVTCKHYGGAVHNMGFMLIYLAPAFMVEITEIWVRAGRVQRMMAIIAGIWMEMIFCAVATVIWWGTPPGTTVHEIAYKFMLITGFMVIIMNVNPLIKLDGYYALGELTGIADLKEKSTAFVSGWVKKNVFRLPVEFDYVPPKRRWLYVPYALLSGVYSYGLLFVVCRFLFNVLSRFTPEWAFLPAGFVAWKIFRSRIIRLVAFMKTVYLDKREKVLRHASRRQKAFATVAALLLLLLPVFRKTIDAPFVLESRSKAIVRAELPGLVEAVYVHEGERVTGGTPILRMKSMAVESEVGAARASLDLSDARAMEALLRYADLGAANSNVARSRSVYAGAMEESRMLEPASSIAGTVTSPRVRDLQGRFVAAGTVLAEVDDETALRARVYLAEYDIRELHPAAAVSLLLKSSSRLFRGTVDSIAIAPSTIPEGLVEQTKYAGLKAPPLYVVDVNVTNPGTLRTGMSGNAKIMVRRCSLLQTIFENARDFADRRFW